jgi:hypothetical protein
MSKIEDRRSEAARTDNAEPRRRPPPLPPMRLNPFAKGCLFGLRLLLGATTAMAAYAALHGVQG